ncbi:MAG: vacuolar membrane-associated protein iml1 [Chrysothrix sp. TS-e1954]|nr:MAG: vacuolar membrane-associated protein iml1 [Chrysothrix sp. TS-e1954]
MVNSQTSLEKQCTLWVHNEAFSKEDVLFNASIFAKDAVHHDQPFTITSIDSGVGVRDFGPSDVNVTELDQPQPPSTEPSFIFLARDASDEMKLKHPSLQVSVSDKIAAAFGFRNRMNVVLAAIDGADHAATHVELAFRDALNRADLWALTTTELKQQQCLFEGQQLHYLGTSKVIVKRIYLHGARLKSALFTHLTRPIFRSESARFVLAIQMSKEMWNFDNSSSGEIIWTKVVTFLDQLFARWSAVSARHVLTVVFFTRIEYDRYECEALERRRIGESGSSSFHRDFYRVIACEAPSHGWGNVQQNLREEFHKFLQDVETQPTDHEGRKHVMGRPSSARHGNILEAINLVASQSLQDEEDPDLLRHGTHIVLLTPRPALFNVEEGMLKLTSDRLVNAGIGVDVVCMAQVPLHTTPLFCLKQRSNASSRSKPSNDNAGILRKSAKGHVSELKGTETTPPHSSSDLDRQSRSLSSFSFVIPTWVEVSFFGNREAHPALMAKARPKFLQRCKMYELQMMGLSESDKNLALPQLESTSFSHDSDFQDQTLGTSVRKRSALHTGNQSEQNQQASFGIGLGDKAERKDSAATGMQVADEFDSKVFSGRNEINEEARKPMKATRPGDGTLSSPSRFDPGTRTQAMQPPRVSHVSGLGALFAGSVLGKAAATTSADSSSVSSAPNTYKDGVLVDATSRTISNQVRNSIQRRSSSQQSLAPKGPSKPIPVDRPKPLRPLTEDSLRNSLSSSADGSIHADSNAFRAASLSKQAKASLPLNEPSKNPSLSRKKAPKYSPWLLVSNPSKPDKETSGVYGGWEHVHTGRRKDITTKWTALTSPAMLPFTTDVAPDAQELKEGFRENPYKLALNEDSITPMSLSSLSDLARQLVCYRLCKGYQVLNSFKASQITGRPQTNSSDIFSSNFLVDDGSTVVMIRGDSVHVLSMTGSDISVTIFTRISVASNSISYVGYVRAELEDEYAMNTLTFFTPREANWNRLDHATSGLQQEAPESHFQADFAALARHHARFMLIPTELWRSTGSNSASEDSDEEIRIEGIRKLTIMWQRFRHSSPEHRATNVAWSGHEDPNPLAIEYQTRDPSVIVAAGLENSLLTNGETTVASTRLFEGAESYKTSSVDLQKLAQDLQSDKGIKMRDRRWHFRVHHFSFEGIELTSFLYANFQDLESREEAVDFGNALMQQGLFFHVHGKHRFRDGNFFYALAGEYRAARSETKSETKSSTWFGTRRPEASVPSTPLSSSSRDVNTPGRTGGDFPWSKRPRVALSAAIEYDLDHRKRSHQPELVSIHYDRLHNPENAFHFQLKWGNATPKLIDDAVTSWSMAMERCGLLLVQAPLREISMMANQNPLRTAYIITLALEAPDVKHRRPNEALTGAQSLGEKHPYHRALLKKLDFILDFEAASCFPSNVDVVYSWGKTNYEHTQFVHCSGLLFAQIGSDGELLLYANRLHAARINSTQRDMSRYEYTTEGLRRSKSNGKSRHNSGALERQSPTSSPLLAARSARESGRYRRETKQDVTVEQIKDQLEGFCHDTEALKAFFEEISEPVTTASEMSTPPLDALSSQPTPARDLSVPILDLPSNFGNDELIVSASSLEDSDKVANPDNK